MHVIVREKVFIDRDRETVFDFLVSEAGFKTFGGWGPVPGIEAVVYSEGSFTEPGSLARVTNTDGSTHRERVLRCERPMLYSIRIHDFSSPFRFLIRRADETWTLEETPDGCLLNRSFEFELRSALVWPLSLPIAQVMFRAAMRRHHRVLEAWGRRSD